MTKYGLVEATPTFIAARLEALSAALLLPRPSRDGFLFDASPGFYASCTESVVTLQRATRRIIQHLGLPCDTVVVSFSSSIAAAAQIEREGPSFFVEIDPRYQNDAHALGAVLAHECSHILVASRRVRLLGNALDEAHVDLAAILAGLGSLTLNGILDDQSSGDVAYQHRSLGYLRADILEHAVGVVASRLGLESDDVVRRLHNPVVRRGVRAAMRGQWLRARLGRTRALAFGPPPSHEIFPCTGTPDKTCEERLRIPGGKRGTAKCPTCKSERSFDGTPLEVRALEEPEPLQDVALPKVRFGEFRTRWRAAPLWTKLFFLVVLGFIPALLLAQGARWYSLARVGEPCANDNGCRSEQCLHVAHGPALPTGPRSSLGIPELDRQLDETVARISDGANPLSPKREDGRFVRTNDAYCTDTCDSSADCPGGFVCGDIQSFRTGALGPDYIVGRGQASRACVKARD